MEGLDVLERNMYYQLGVVSSCSHCNNLEGQRATMKMMECSKETPLSVVRQCGFGVVGWKSCLAKHQGKSLVEILLLGKVLSV